MRHNATAWVRLLRVMAYVEIAGGCLLSVLMGLGVAFGSQGPWVLGVVLGLLVAAIGVLFSFVGAAAIMVFLDMAEDIHAIRNDVEHRP